MVFNIISEIILLSVVPCNLIIERIYKFRSEKYYILNLTVLIMRVAYICNILILFQFLNLVFMVKQMYSHPKKPLNNWISGKVSRPISLINENVRNIQFDRAHDHVNIKGLTVSRLGNIDGTLQQTDIHLLR